MWYITQQVECEKGKMKIFLCGFSGAGKSSILAELKNEICLKGFEVLDLDDLIQEKYAGEVPLGQYIQRIGIEHFRALEKNEIEILSRKENPILLALGGGSLSSETLPILEASWIGLHLECDFELCWQRIKKDSNRPLVLLGKEHLFQLYQERIEFYKLFKSCRDRDEALNSIKEILIN